MRSLTPDDPTVVGHYRLLGRLGQGGMGAVYYGAGPDGRPVAVKVIRRELATDPGFRARFADEVGNARKVASFCTAQVLDHGEADGSPYLVTEYIEGPSLGDYVAEHGPMPPEPLRALAVGIATALVSIHGVRLVHRDLKPSNVLLSASGPRVIDFGVARAVDSSSHHTQTGFIVGSPGWIAPEQVFDGQVGTAADVFTWGSLIAFAATGRHPYGSGNLMVLATRAHQGAHDLSEVPGELRPLIASALEPDPARRPSADDLLVALVGDEGDPQTGAQRMVTSAWTPGALPAAVFSPPVVPPPPAVPGPATPLPGPMPAPAPMAVPHHVTPPPFMAPPPMAQPAMAQPPVSPPVPPMPVTAPHARGPRSAGPLVALAMTGVLVAASAIGFGLYSLQRKSDRALDDLRRLSLPSVSASVPQTGSEGGQGTGGGDLAALPVLCPHLAKALPAKVRGLPMEKSKLDAPDNRPCSWDRYQLDSAVNLSVHTQLHRAIGDRTGAERAAEQLSDDWSYFADPEYHQDREKLTGLGDEAIAAKLFSPVFYGQTQASARNYWMGGAKVYVRHRNAIIEIRWTAADYPPAARNSRSLKGRNLPYAQARQEAVRLARAVLAQLR